MTWLAMDEAAKYLKYRSKHAPTVVRIILQRRGVPLYRRNNKSFLVRQDDLDEFILTDDCVRGRQYQIQMRNESRELRNQITRKLLAPKTTDEAAPKRPRGRPPKRVEVAPEPDEATIASTAHYEDKLERLEREAARAEGGT